MVGDFKIGQEQYLKWQNMVVYRVKAHLMKLTPAMKSDVQVRTEFSMLPLLFSNSLKLSNVFNLIFISVNCRWGKWSSWESCSKSCGGGIQYRTRTVSQLAEHGGLQCKGSPYETNTCNEVGCPGDNGMLNVAFTIS